MIEHRESKRRSSANRRNNSGRRVKEEEWIPVYGSRRVNTPSDRRQKQRRCSDRRTLTS